MPDENQNYTENNQPARLQPIPGINNQGVAQPTPEPVQEPQFQQDPQPQQQPLQTAITNPNYTQTSQPTSQQPTSPAPEVPATQGSWIQPTAQNATAEPQPTAPQPVAYPGVIGSGPSPQAAVPVPSSQAGPAPNLKPSKWRYFFATLGILQIVGIAIFLFGLQQGSSGVTGSEFIVLALFVMYLPILALIALINIVGLPIYLFKRKPRGKKLIPGIISLAISLLLVGYGAFVTIQALGAFADFRGRAYEAQQLSE